MHLRFQVQVIDIEILKSPKNKADFFVTALLSHLRAKWQNAPKLL
jgi:hypothetical protein